jgi:hypothetical protein
MYLKVRYLTYLRWKEGAGKARVVAWEGAAEEILGPRQSETPQGSEDQRMARCEGTNALSQF